MPKDIQEILNEIGNTKFTSLSGPLLELCRELAMDGRFDEFADYISIWLSMLPSSRNFILASIPTIILNSYIAKQEILSFEEFLKWETTYNWRENIQNSATDRNKLPFIIESIKNSMCSFQKNS